MLVPKKSEMEPEPICRWLLFCSQYWHCAVFEKMKISSALLIVFGNKAKGGKKKEAVPTSLRGERTKAEKYPSLKQVFYYQKLNALVQIT